MFLRSGMFGTSMFPAQFVLTRFLCLSSLFLLSFSFSFSLHSCFGRTTQTGYVNYESFVNALYELAEHALGKPTFEPLYPTSQAKVDVMLNLWGLADTSRLTQINSKRNV